MIFFKAFTGLLFLSIAGFFLFLTDGFFGGLDFPTGDEEIGQVSGMIQRKRLESGILYDLGSARGNFAAKIAKANPKLTVYGIDDSWFRIFPSRVRALFLKNLTFKKENIFAADLSEADIIYIYLPQELMASLETSLQKELKPGAIIITNRVSFPAWRESEKNGQLFLYAKE